MNIEDKIKNLQEQIEALKIEQEALSCLQSYTMVKDRWDKVYYSSAEVNERAEGYDLSHACGCCDDSPLYLMPFITLSGIKVYSDPFQICIGSKSKYRNCGEELSYEFRSICKKYNIPEWIVEELDEKFNQQEEDVADDT